jgi:non-heme chloroperoxidase
VKEAPWLAMVQRDRHPHHNALTGRLDQFYLKCLVQAFRFAFANAVDESEAHELYETYSVPSSGVPILQAATANLNPWTEAQVDTKNPGRGPLLIISGEHDHTVPWVIAHASYKRQQENPAVTEIREIPGRGHSLTIDHGWREVAETGLAFIAQQLQKG